MLRLAIAGLLLTTTALAQEPSPRPAQPGRVTGVVTTDAGLPAAGATVTITSSVTGPTISRRSAVSDISGTFEFQDVTPGAHRLAVSKPGLFQLGDANAILSGGRSVVVRPGEHVKSATLTLTRGGVVTGRIVDEFGEPVDQLEVYAMRYAQGMDGQRTLLRAGDGDLTDDRGEFRVFGLMPGEYKVLAMTAPAPVNAAFTPMRGPSGPFETLPIYFPGTSDVAQAQSITIDAGQEASATFTWRRHRALRIAGVVLSPQPLVGASISLGSSNSSGTPTPVSANGSFVIEGVAPGDYTLSVRSGRAPVSNTPVSVRDADITGLVVTMKPPVIVRGYVTFEGTPPREAPVPLRLMSSEGGSLMALVAGDYALVQPDGQFVGETAASHVTVEPPTGWSLSALTVGGTDALNSGIDLRDRTVVEDVRIRLTDRLTQVLGRVTSDRGVPVDSAMVLVLQLEAGAAPLRSILRTIATDADGRFEVRGLRRGSYVAAALDAGERPITDDAFLDRLRRDGERFSLQDGQSVTINLAPSEGLR